MGTDCCAIVHVKSLLTVGGHVFVSRDTSLDDPRCNSIPCERPSGVVCELTVTGGIDRDTIHKLLFAQRRQVVGDHESGIFKGIRGRVSHHSALPRYAQELCG